jgi:hypothetical protein
MGYHADCYLHIAKGVGRSNKTASYGYGLTNVARYSNRDQIEAPNAAVIESDPASAWYVDLHPGMGRAQILRSFYVLTRIIEIAGTIRAPKPRLRVASTKSTAKSRQEPDPRSRV